VEIHQNALVIHGKTPPEHMHPLEVGQTVKTAPVQ
jgi:hypothetical protein